MTKNENDDSKLLKICSEALNSFSSEDQSVDQFLNHLLNANESLSDEDCNFITEVFSGCIYYKKALQNAIDIFYKNEGSLILKKHSSLLLTLLYLILFRTSDVDFDHLLNLTSSLYPLNVILTFLQFLLNSIEDDSKLYFCWTPVYDSDFVEKNLIFNLHQRNHDLTALMTSLNDLKLTKKQKRDVTVTKEFDLTKPKPRSIPLPKSIPKICAALPAPKSTFQAPKTEYLKPEKKTPKPKTQISSGKPMSEKTRARLDAIRMEEDAKLQFDKQLRIEKPKANRREVKMNIAAILREEARLEKKQKMAEEELEKLMKGGFDASRFESWQKEKLDEDARREKVKEARLQLESKITREDAIIARQKTQEKNRIKAEKLREENNRLKDEMIEMRIAEEARCVLLIEEIRKMNFEDSKEKLKEKKRKIRKEVDLESRKLMKEALLREEEQLRHRSEVIAEIRLMERSIKRRENQPLDVTSSAGHRLNCEMSLSELWERLQMLREKEIEARERRHDVIKEMKQKKIDDLEAKVKKISIFKEETSRVMTSQKQKKIEDEKKEG